ncbi:lysophospholipase [Mycolicibacterium rhodesiae NBB3]|jgi:pimeloyl-ACP methyl ester carboxylesterase|uniref:Lysophospholipase n=1 Tax=Mycolicibacterium rhodesiae (strain NBB3) TaxID=710685 RepID=G8RQ56_MYCRN|nr:alpha/beta fold hydrolase [Mycolicibacterium rhodesiae]AEV75129.1 lysophospholipase [Mycolicibacterium rhodesiae NBB3]
MSDDRHVVLIHGAWSRGDQLSDARRAFEARGYTVHTPTLRHHELPPAEGASKIASLSLMDYVDDLVALVESLDSPPLIVGHSLGAYIGQLLAARIAHVGLVAACPSSAGAAALTAPSLRITLGHFRQKRPWAMPVKLDWKVFRSAVAPTLPDDLARQIYADLVYESRRVLFWELAHPRLDRKKAAAVDFARITTPVLIIAGERDRIVPASHVRKVPSRFANARYVEIAGSDHMVLSGKALDVTMGHVDDWLADSGLSVAN